MHMQKYVIARDSSAAKKYRKPIKFQYSRGLGKAIASSAHNIYKSLGHYFNYQW